MTSHAMDEDALNANAGRALENARLPAVAGRNERRVRRDFWGKLRRVLSRLPFARELAAAFYCATDPATPAHVKGLLFAALAYFILPLDFVPDIILGLGFTDDATVIAMAVALVRAHLKAEHYQAADKALRDIAKD